MKMSVAVLYFICLCCANNIANYILYLLGFIKKDTRCKKIVLLGEEVSVKSACVIDVVVAGVIFVLFKLFTNGIDNVIITYTTTENTLGIALFFTTIVVRILMAIKDKAYKNRGYNRILDSIDKIDILIGGISSAREFINDTNKRDRLYNLYKLAIKLKEELVYQKSLCDLYTVTNVSKCIGNSNAEIAELVTEIDKMNALNELSRKEIESLYGEIQKQLMTT